MLLMTTNNNRPTDNEIESNQSLSWKEIISFVFFVVIAMATVNKKIRRMASSESTGSVDLSLDVERQESVIGNIFGRQISKIGRNHSKYLALKIKVYVILHKPVGYSLLYHLSILVLIFISVIVLNLFDEQLANQGKWFSNIIFFKVVTDGILVVILFIELMTRLWSCDCVIHYRGLKGRYFYWSDFWFNRTLEVFGIIFFAAFIINFLVYTNTTFDSNIRLAQLTQVLQCYRVLFRVLGLMTITITSQKNQIIIVLVLAVLNLIIASLTIYLCEREANNKINTIFDAFWVTFITFTTIGYGDTVPITDVGKWVMGLYSFFGIIFLAIPGSILGTGLALKIQETEKAVMYRVPSAKLIQCAWRCYSTNQNTAHSPFWSLYHRSDGRELTHNDRSCIRFIRLVMYLKQRHRFKIKLGSVKDDFFRDKSTREMLRKLIIIEKDINKTKIVHSGKTLSNLEKSQILIKKLRDKFGQIKDRKSNEKDKQKDTKTDNTRHESENETKAKH